MSIALKRIAMNKLQYVIVCSILAVSFHGCSSDSQVSQKKKGVVAKTQGVEPKLNQYNKWRIDPTFRYKNRKNPFVAWFNKLPGGAKYGQIVIAELNVVPLADAPKVQVKFQISDNVDIVSGETNGEFLNVRAKTKYTHTMKIRCNSPCELLAGIDMPFPPHANYHLTKRFTVGKMPEQKMPGVSKTIGGVRMRAIELPESAKEVTR